MSETNGDWRRKMSEIEDEEPDFPNTGRVAVSSESALRAEYLRGLKRAEEIAEAEEELDGNPLHLSEEGLVVARSIVIATKKSIASAIRVEIEKEKDT